jgi:putative ABC transport system ATP-binding protein
MKMISVQNLNKSYRVRNHTHFQVLHDINLDICNGEMVAIMGPSGSGKSTLLHILSGLIPFDSGQIDIDDIKLNNLSSDSLAEMRNKKMSIIFQNFALIEDFTVYDNVLLPLCFSKKKTNINKTVENILKSLKIEDYKNQQVCMLSGGEKQRVAIARGIVNSPQYILADEPTGALDSETSKDVIDILESLNKSGSTVIIVTHNDEIANRCMRKIEIKDGRIA